MAKITITNVLTKVISDATGVEAVISPTGITKPCTPIQEYVGDMATIVNGTLLIPAYNKVQMLSIPFGAKFTFDATDAREINYWENIKVNGAEIKVDQAGQAESTGLSPVEEYIYTVLSSDKAPKNWGTASTFYTVDDQEESGYKVVTFTGEGTTESPYVPAYVKNTYYTRKKNVLPTNDKQD